MLLLQSDATLVVRCYSVSPFPGPNPEKIMNLELNQIGPHSDIGNDNDNDLCAKVTFDERRTHQASAHSDIGNSVQRQVSQ